MSDGPQMLLRIRRTMMWWNRNKQRGMAYIETMTPALEAFTQAMEDANKIFDDPQCDVEAYTKAVEDACKSHDGIQDAAIRAFEQND